MVRLQKVKRGRQLSDMEDIAGKVAAFSDDGKGVQCEQVMLEAMKRAKALNRLIAAHCEDERLLNGGYIHQEVCPEAFTQGIPSESEWRQVERDIDLVRKTAVPIMSAMSQQRKAWS